MKKFLSLLLAALMLLGLALPASAEELPLVLPKVENLLDAPKVYEESAEDGSSVYYGYAPATEDHLYCFLTLSAMVGTYAMESTTSTEDTLVYILVSPGSFTMAAVAYTPAEQLLQVETLGAFTPMGDEDAQSILDVLAQGFIYPEGTSGYIFPLFSAVAGKNYDGAGQVSDVAYIFNNQTCWAETYTGIGMDVIGLYTQLMLQYGFDVLLDDNGSPMLNDPIWLHFTNGDMEVILQYSYTDQMATVYTKPGVSPMPHILTQEQIVESLSF